MTDKKTEARLLAMAKAVMKATPAMPMEEMKAEMNAGYEAMMAKAEEMSGGLATEKEKNQHCIYGMIQATIFCSIGLVKSIPDQRAKIIENCCDQLLGDMKNVIGEGGITGADIQQILSLVYHIILKDTNDPTGVLREVCLQLPLAIQRDKQKGAVNVSDKV